jgi:hypothetical protein
MQTLERTQEVGSVEPSTNLLCADGTTKTDAVGFCRGT